MIRIRVIPAHSCSAITETEQFKWTQIWGAVVIVTTSNTCKTRIMRTMPALSVTCIHPHSFSRSRRTLLPLTCRWEKHHEPVPAIPSNPRQCQPEEHRYPPPASPKGPDHFWAGNCTGQAAGSWHKHRPKGMWMGSFFCVYNTYIAQMLIFWVCKNPMAQVPHHRNGNAAGCSILDNGA